jgi:hypothetical protein
MSFIRREQRDLARMRGAYASTRARGGSAMDIACAQIDSAFGEAAEVNGFKLRVERLIGLGPHHRAVRARFGARTDLLLGRNLNEAIALVERWWRDERKAFQIASALGCGTRLSLEVQRELRLVLRLMRFKRMQAQFEPIVAALSGESFAAAAE